MSHIKGSAISNLTDQELFASVYHTFPNIKGLLKQLLDRFEEIVDTLDLDEQAKSASEIDCPNCGTKIPADIEL